MDRRRSPTSYIRSVALVAMLALSITSHGAAAADNCNSAKSNTSGVTFVQAVGGCAEASPGMGASVAQFLVPRAAGDPILGMDVSLEPVETRNEQAGNPADGWRFAPGGSARLMMR